MVKYKPSKHVVAYIDLLGVKERIKNNSEGLASTLHDVYTCVNDVIRSLADGDEIKVKVFSDNIIFARSVTEGRENQRINLHQMIAIVEAFQYILLYKAKYLMRGGIVIGELYIDDMFTIGQALVDAYYLEDKQAIYPRVIIENSLLPIIQNNAHTSTDVDGLRYIDFLSMASDEQTRNVTLSVYDDIIQSGLSSETDKKVIQKLKWCETYKHTWIQKNS